MISAFGATLSAADHQAFGDMERYLPAEAAGRNSYSLAADAERFRSYARVDKAYRLMQAGKLELARQELLPLINRSREDWRACSAYLSTLYRLGEYAELIRQADLILADKPYFIPGLLYRSQAYLASGHVKEAIAGFEILERRPELIPADRLSVFERLADLYIKVKNYQSALATSIRLIELQSNYQNWFRKGLALDGLDRLEDAEHVYRCALKLASTPAQRLQAWKAIAETLRKAKKWPAATEMLQQALELKPDDEPLLRSLAQTEYQLQNYQAAEGHMRRLIALHPDAADREFLANLLLLRKNWQGAREEFKILLADQSEPARSARAYRTLSQIAEKTNDPGQSVAFLKRALAIEPSLAGREGLANLLIKQGKFVEGDSILSNLAKEPRSAEDKHRVLLMLGQVKMSEKQYSTAAAVFADAARIKGDASTLAAASNAAARAGDLRSAAEFSRRAAAGAPSAEAYLRLGTLQKGSLDLTHAVASFEIAAKLSTTPAQKIAIYKEIAWLSIHSKDYEGARRSFEKAALVDPRDPGLQRSIAYAFSWMKRYADAATHLKQAIAIDNAADDWRALGMAQEMEGQIDAAIATDSKLLSRLARSSIEREGVCVSLAELEAKRGNHAQAAHWWMEAFQSRPDAAPELLASAAESLILSQQWVSAADLYGRYLASTNPSTKERAHAFESLAFVSAKLGKDEAAAEYLQHAIDTAAAGASAHDNLGFVLFRLGRWRPALNAFLASPASEANPTRLTAIAHCYQKLGKPGLAIHFFETALQQPRKLTTTERRQAFAELGFLYADGQDYRAAIEAWQQAQGLGPIPSLALGLARLYRLAGDAAAAQLQLNQIHSDSLPQAEQAQYFDEWAQVYAKQGREEDSRHAWERANQIESSPAREYEIGLAYLRNEETVEAIPFLERAVKSSGNKVYLESLAYAYKSAGRLRDAVACFEKLAAAEPVNLEAQKELAYLEMRLGHNTSAEHWFRQAIDIESEAQPAMQTAALASSNESLRADLARLTNRYDATMYDGYSSDRQVFSVTPEPGANSSITPSGGGVEFAYQPAEIGFRNERVLQVFARALWNNQPGSFTPQGKSEQMSLGLRYKPLVSQNLQVSFERLIPLASGLQQNWMLRAMSSWCAGYKLRPAQRISNYSLLFVDTAYLFQTPRTAAELAQFRQGVTFRAGQSLLITPHLLAAARHQSPQAEIGTYIETGLGLSLRFLPRESVFEPRKTSFEALFDCHKGFMLAQRQVPSYQGCRATGIMRF
jgi:tetratricopeptide (TPR) repeat protein